MSDSNKPGGAIWKTGIHKVSLGGQPVRLAAPQYSLIQNYNLMKRKIREKGHIPIGIDHIPEQVLKTSPVLEKLLKEHELDPYDVGKIRNVSTDGESIRITDAEFTHPTVQELFNNGELQAWSVVENIKSTECPTDKADVVADYFTDIERVDLVGKGGCETCLVEGGGVPEGYERINANFMEVDTLTEEEKKKKENETTVDETNMENNSSEQEESQEQEEKEENDPVSVLQGQVAKLTDTVSTLATTVSGIVDGTIEAKLPENVEEKLKQVDEMKLEAQKSLVVAQIDGKIQAGYVTPAMKDGLLKAGLSMKEDDFQELLAGYKEKLWDPKTFAEHSNDDNGDESLSLDEMRQARKQGRF